MIGNVIKLGAYALLAKEVAGTVVGTASQHAREQIRRERNSALSGTLIGLAVGVGLGILYAPRPGKETREKLSDSAAEQLERLQSNIIEGKDHVVEILGKKAEALCPEREEEQKASS